MKNKFLMLLPITAATLLAACGEGGETPAPQVDVGDITSETTITFWHNMNDSNTAEMTKIKDAFEKANPLIKVNLVKQTGSYNDLLVKTEEGIPANNYPDIFYGYPDSVQTLMNYGVVIDMDAYINNEKHGWTAKEKSDVVTDYLKEGQSFAIKGTYALPLCKSTEAMYYNPRVIGIDLSKIDASINGAKPLTKEYINNLTWDELFDKLCPALETYNNGLAADAKLYTPSSNGKSAIVGYDSDNNLFITLAEQYGYDYTSINAQTGAGELKFINDGMKSLMKKFNKATQKKYFFTGGTSGDTYTSGYTTAQNTVFGIGSTAGLSNQYTDSYTCAIARIPHAPGRDMKVINQGPSVAFLDHKDSQRALASWLFYKYLSNTANATTWSINTNYLPIRKSVFSSDQWTAYLNTENPEMDAKMAIQQFEYVQDVSSDLYSSPVFKGSAEARQQVGILTVSALTAENLTDAQLDSFFQLAYENTLKKM